MKHAYIETFGCQMNKADSEHMLGLLNEIDYKHTEDIDKADLKQYQASLLAFEKAYNQVINSFGSENNHPCVKYPKFKTRILK